MFSKDKNEALIKSITEREKLLPKEINIYFVISFCIGLLSVYFTAEGAYSYAKTITDPKLDISLLYYIIFWVLILLIVLRNVVLETVATYAKANAKTVKDNIRNTIFNKPSDNLNPLRLTLGISITLIFLAGDYSFIKDSIGNFKDNTSLEIIQKDRNLIMQDNLITK